MEKTTPETENKQTTIEEWAESLNLQNLPEQIIGGLAPGGYEAPGQNLSLFVIKADSCRPKPEGYDAVIGVYDFNCDPDGKYWKDEDYDNLLNTEGKIIREVLEKNGLKVAPDITGNTEEQNRIDKVNIANEIMEAVKDGKPVTIEYMTKPNNAGHYYGVIYYATLGLDDTEEIYIKKLLNIHIVVNNSIHNVKPGENGNELEMEFDKPYWINLHETGLPPIIKEGDKFPKQQFFQEEGESKRRFNLKIKTAKGFAPTIQMEGTDYFSDKINGIINKIDQQGNLELE